MKRRLPLLGLALGVSLAGWTAVAQAHGGPSGDRTHIDEGQVVNSTLFVAGRDLQMAGEVEGDYICAGQNVVISGRVQGDVICAAQNIRLTGTVDGDVRLMTQTAALTGPIAGSLSVAAQSVNIEASATVARDVSLAATDGTMNGTVGRDVQVVADQLTIANTVGRNVRASVDNLELTSGARVAGDISYTSDRDLRRDPAAQVAGTVDRHDQPVESGDSGGSNAWWSVIWLLMLLSLLATAMILVWLLPRQFQRMADVAWRQPALAVLVGFMASILMPAVVLVLALTVFGLPLAFLIGVLWLLILFLSGPVAAFLLGRLLLRNQRQPWMMMLIGGALLAVLYSIPLLNVAVATAVIWVGSGTILLTFLERVRMRPKTKLEEQSDAHASSVGRTNNRRSRS